jgi:hypothetical protein
MEQVNWRDKESVWITVYKYKVGAATFAISWWDLIEGKMVHMLVYLSGETVGTLRKSTGFNHDLFTVLVRNLKLSESTAFMAALEV